MRRHSATRFASTLLLVVMVFLLLPAKPALAATQSIGGTAAEGNLRIDVYDNGAMAVGQYISGVWVENIYGINAKGSSLCVATTRYDMGGDSSYTPVSGGTPATPVSNTGGGAGTGTIVSTWTAGGMTIVQTTSYTDGNQYYTINWAVTNTSGAAINDLRLFHGQDTYLGGSDAGYSWWNAGLGAHGSIGVTHPVSTQQMWLQPVSEAPFNYVSGNYYYDARLGVDACALSGVASGVLDDNGYALEFRRASLANGATWSVTLEEHFVATAPPTPTITDISPNTGPDAGGTSVVITGTNFTGSSVYFGGAYATCTVDSPTQITCTSPTHIIGAVDVVVSNSGGSATSTNGFTYTGAFPTAPVSVPADGAVLFQPGPTQLQVIFSENVKGDGSAGAANNAINYRLFEDGADGVFDTVNCLLGVHANDTNIVIDSVTYNPTTFTATLNINGGVPLPVGNYRLLACGTTSIEDPAGNELNGGATDTPFGFSVAVAGAAALPATGFAPGVTTVLPAQPAELAYAGSDLWLEIPSLGVTANIVGVPMQDGNWNVAWLGQDVGWLNGTAFPTREGNSVLTAHVYDSYGQAGPFLNLRTLAYDDRIVVHAYGQEYVFAVRNSRLVSSDNPEYAFRHLEGYSYLTLVTCQGYNADTGEYRWRRVVRAVLVDVR